MFSELFYEQNKTEYHNNWEDRGKEQSGLRVDSKGVGDSSDHGRAYGCTEIDKELSQIEYHRHERDHFKRYFVIVFECQKQKGSKICRNCLCYKSEIAGYQSFL